MSVLVYAYVRNMCVSMCVCVWVRSDGMGVRAGVLVSGRVSVSPYSPPGCVLIHHIHPQGVPSSTLFTPRVCPHPSYSPPGCALTFVLVSSGLYMHAYYRGE